MLRPRLLWLRWRISIRHAWIDFSKSHRYFLLVQACLGIASFVLFIHLPPSGVAVALIAFVAAAMSVHGEMRPWQKVVWMSIIGILLVIEIRAIRHDHKMDNEEMNSILTNQQTGFTATAKTLETVISNGNQQFQETAQGLQKSLQATSALLKQTTPRALISVSKVLEKVIPEKDFNVNDFKAGEPYVYQIRYRNVGNAVAKQVLPFTDIYFGPKDNIEAEREISKKLEADWKSFKKTHTKVLPALPVSSADSWITVESHPLSAQEIDDVQQLPQMTAYIIVRFGYKDPGGFWISDTCMSVQKPFESVPIFHTCMLIGQDSPRLIRQPESP